MECIEICNERNKYASKSHGGHNSMNSQMSESWRRRRLHKAAAAGRERGLGRQVAGGQGAGRCGAGFELA